MGTSFSVCGMKIKQGEDVYYKTHRVGTLSKEDKEDVYVSLLAEIGLDDQITGHRVPCCFNIRLKESDEKDHVFVYFRSYCSEPVSIPLDGDNLFHQNCLSLSQWIPLNKKFRLVRENKKLVLQDYKEDEDEEEGGKRGTGEKG